MKKDIFWVFDVWWFILANETLPWKFLDPFLVDEIGDISISNQATRVCKCEFKVAYSISNKVINLYFNLILIEL